MYAPKCVTPGVSAWSHRSMSLEISCHLRFHVSLRFNFIEISYHLRFPVIWDFLSFDISCHLTFRVNWLFVSFISSWQLTFPVIWQFVSFVISFELGNLSHYSNHSHQSHLGINPSCYRGPVCAQKVGCCIVIGRYGYKSSFRANKRKPWVHCPIAHTIRTKLTSRTWK